MAKLRRVHNRALTLLENPINCINNVDDVYRFFVLLKMYKCINICNHDYFNMKLELQLPNHYHCTRHVESSCFNIPFYHKSLSKKFYFYNCINAWNSLPGDIKESNSLLSFKKKLKNYLLHI